MLLFLRAPHEADTVITTADRTITLERDGVRYARLPPGGGRHIVPWYRIDADPEVFGRRLLNVAMADPVCQGLCRRATEVWQVDYLIEAGQFRSREVHDKYLKQLRIWLNPLSGNMGSHRNAHRSTVEEQHARFGHEYEGDLEALRTVSQLPFFQGMSVAGRRDRIPCYRNVTEAARALVGEVTTGPSRSIEKIVALSLLRSTGLAALQRRMLAAVADAERRRAVTLAYGQWEYLPYYLQRPLDVKVSDETARPLVLGTLHDCLNDAPETHAAADQAVIATFRADAHGATYRYWRKLPAVVRYQVMISDLSRMFPGDSSVGAHQRWEFDRAMLQGLPASLSGFNTWTAAMHAHSNPVGHEPGGQFRFAGNWARNEFCPNVVSSRLLLAPLYAGTSGHTQGRIRKWRAQASLRTALTRIPVGVVISAGYAVLWRLYYDKRVSGFHTLFESLQGSHIDTGQSTQGDAGPVAREDVWNILVDYSRSGRVDVRGFWNACIREFLRPGVFLERHLKARLAHERDAVRQVCGDAVIPHWSETADVDITGTEVAAWSPAQDLKVVGRHEAFNALAERQVAVAAMSASSSASTASSSSTSPPPAIETLSPREIDVMDRLSKLIGDYL